MIKPTGSTVFYFFDNQYLNFTLTLHFVIISILFSNIELLTRMHIYVLYSIVTKETN